MGQQDPNRCRCEIHLCSCPLRLDELTSTTYLATREARNINRRNSHCPQQDNTSPDVKPTMLPSFLSTSCNSSTDYYLVKIAKLSNRRFPISSILLTTLVCCLLLERSLMSQADQNPVYGIRAHYPPPSTPSLCPLVPACQCKWSNGKQSASCDKRNLAHVPSNLPEDTQILDMSGSNLLQLAPYTFQDKHLTNLQKIFLADSKIAAIADEAFAHLTNMIELDLSSNLLQQVPVKSLEQVSQSLRKLSLANNPIQVLEPDSFSSLLQLNLLDLSGCHLSQLHPGAFRGLQQLKELKLHDNRLSQLTMGVMNDLREYLIIDLYSNPWYCDCELRQSIEWMSSHHIQQSIIPSCASPERHKHIRWHKIKSEEFMCPPTVISKQNELTVGAGSNVSLYCTARGSAPLTFIWYQNEMNLTAKGGNQSEPPPTTKLLEEKRYEIAEELGPANNPNITTSVLYLYDLRINDTGLFLCMVENVAGYEMVKFSLVVNDSPPAQLYGNPSSTNSFLRSLGLTAAEAQVGIIFIGFLLVLVASIMFLLMLKQTRRSSKSSQSNEPIKEDAKAVQLSASNFSRNNGNQRQMFATTDTDDTDDTDDHASSGSSSSCRKGPKVMAPGNLEGFIEHMRSGIINMDYHTMSPVIQFNNTLKKGSQQQPQQQLNYQPIHHFTSASNASSVLPGYGNGSTSMATTTSDLSPSSVNTNFANNGPITNCDLQHQLNDMGAPATNTTTTSYTSDYQSGYSDEPNMMPPHYYDTDIAHHHSLQHHGSVYNSAMVIGHPMMNQPHPHQIQPHMQQQQPQHLVMQDTMHNNRSQRLRLDNEFQIL